MVLDTIDKLQNYASIHPGIPAVIGYIKKTNFSLLSSGKYEIVKGKIFVTVDNSDGKGLTGAKLEAHKKFIDIQYAISGIDIIGWKSVFKCQNPQNPFDDSKDIQFFSDAPDTWLDVKEGMFALLLPTDAHAPLAFEGQVRKAIFKVAVNW